MAYDTENGTATRPRRARNRLVAPPSLARLISPTLVALAAYIALSVALAPAAIRDYNFASEQGSVTMLSSGMLLTACCAAAVTLWTMRRGTRRARLLWTTLTALMFYFAVDEVLEFHERMGDFLGAHVSSGPFRNWNDVVVIVYGVLAVPLALLLWREVFRYRRLFTMLVITGALYVATTAVDTFTEPPTVLSNIVEEGIKVSCSTFFALSMLTGLVAARRLVVDRGRSGLSEPFDRPGRSGRGASALDPRTVVTALTGIVLIMLTAGLGTVVLSSGHARILATWIGGAVGAAVLLRAVLQADRS